MLPKGVIDLSGQRFGRLLVTGFSHLARRAHWRVRCDCGRERIVSSNDLRSGHTTSCGCAKRPDISGQRFGQLTAIRYSHSVAQKNGAFAMWIVRCDCGTEVVTRSAALLSGGTTSCGCARFIKKRVAIRRRLESQRKKCCRCGIEKSLEEFDRSPNTPDRRTSACRPCLRSTRLKLKYGITAEEKRAMIRAQHRRCANSSCSARVTMTSPTDHCHASGKVRGVLCSNCNTALGLLGDSPKRIHGLLLYAQRHRQLTLN